MSLLFTPTYSDHFTPDANPLTPANWTTYTNNHAPYHPLQASSGACVSTIADPNGLNTELANAATATNPYIKFTLGIFGPLGNGQEIDVGFRSDINPVNFGDGWYVSIFDNGDGLTADLNASVQYGNGTEELDFFDNASYVPVDGTTYTFAAIGTVGYFFVNGVQIASSDAASVNPRMTGPSTPLLYSPVDLTYPTITYFEMGSVALAVPGGFSRRWISQ